MANRKHKNRKSGPRSKSGRLSRAYKSVAQDFGTREVQAHRKALVGEGDPVFSVTMPGLLLTKGLIDQNQYKAAERFRALRCALYGPPWPASGDGVIGIRPDLELAKIKTAYDHLVRVLGKLRAPVVRAVCVFDLPPRPAELPLLVGGLAAIAK